MKSGSLLERSSPENGWVGCLNTTIAMLLKYPARNNCTETGPPTVCAFQWQSQIPERDSWPQLVSPSQNRPRISRFTFAKFRLGKNLTVGSINTPYGIDYDGERGQISITFRPTGFNGLIERLTQEDPA